MFAAFLDELFERFTNRVDSPEGDTPHEQLDTLLQVLLTTDADPSLREFRTAMLELKAQAPYNPTLQERLTQFDEHIEPARDAEYLTTTITGAHTRHIAINQSSDRLYATMTRYIERHLLTDKQPVVAR